MFSAVVVQCSVLASSRPWIALCAALAMACGGASSHESESADSPECVRPPWYPPKPPLAVRVSSCKDDRTLRFVLGRGAPVTDVVANQFLDDHRWEFHAVNGITGSGYGLCCTEDDGDLDEQCVAFDLRQCSTPLPEFIDTVREIQAQDEHVAHRALRVSVRLEGLNGPRCDADSPRCTALPYDEDHNMREPPEQRSVVLPPNGEGPNCEHDGECVKNGCGNECDHWTLGGMAGTCPYILKLQDAFCGCVENRCAWFH